MKNELYQDFHFFPFYTHGVPSVREKSVTFALEQLKTTYETDDDNRVAAAGHECNGFTKRPNDQCPKQPNDLCPKRPACPMRSCADGEPVALAGHGDVCLHPLFDEHVHRSGVGLRQ